MSHKTCTMYTCDHCGAQDEARSGHGYEKDSIPSGWLQLAIQNPSDSKLWDLCGKCSSEARELIRAFLANKPT